MQRGVRHREARARAGERGFSIIELGIVLGVLAVLSAVVLLGRGYVQASRESAAAELIRTLRTSARSWAERTNAGLSYTGISQGALTVASARTPWGDTPAVTATSTPSASCAGDACVKICLRVPSNDACTNLLTTVPNAVASDCSVPCGGPCLCVTTR